MPIQVRFADTDASGHINNVSYIAYFELGRTSYFRDLFGATNTFGQGFILGEVSCRYLAQAYFGDPLEVWCGLGKVGRASFESLYRLVNTDTKVVVAKGTSITVAYDFKSGRTVRIGEDWRRAAAAHEGWPEESLIA